MTTSSAEARAEFLKGRDNFEKLLITDSIAHFQKAVSLDPNFAWAELALANSAPTGKEFFEHLNKAVSLADKASNGEKLLILAAEAGANANPAKQKEHLDALVAAYPNDERAHFNLGGYHFGQQEYPQAIEQYRKATELEPGYSTAYNLLGYSYRQAGDFANAEKAFQKYIELIPKDPNPYDSYAELLLKMGRFDDSIVQYRKALEIDSNFVNAHQGIAMDLLYSGKAAEAEAELANITKKARTDGERRTALFALTVVHIDGGKMAKALEDVDKQYALGEKTNDVPAMSAANGLKGNILLETGKPDQARAEYERALKLVEGSSLSPEVKANAALVSHYNLARVAVAKKDFKTAKSEADAFRKGAEAKKNPAQVKNAHRARRNHRPGGEGLRPGDRRAPAGEPAESPGPLSPLPGLQGKGRRGRRRRSLATRPRTSTRCPRSTTPSFERKRRPRPEQPGRADPAAPFAQSSAAKPGASQEGARRARRVTAGHPATAKRSGHAAASPA